jgi:hypothetical protein
LEGEFWRIVVFQDGEKPSLQNVKEVPHSLIDHQEFPVVEPVFCCAGFSFLEMKVRTARRLATTFEGRHSWRWLKCPWPERMERLDVNETGQQIERRSFTLVEICDEYVSPGEKI